MVAIISVRFVEVENKKLLAISQISNIKACTVEPRYYESIYIEVLVLSKLMFGSSCATY